MLEWEPDLIDRLEEKESDIIECILHLIAEEEQTIAACEILEYSVPDFEQELTLTFTKPSRKPFSRISWYGVSRPVFYAKGNYQKRGEYRKFGDVICAAIGQLLPDEINVVVITSASKIYEAIDLDEAIASLLREVQKRNDTLFQGKDFDGTRDFIRQFDRLSCVVFKSIFMESRNDEALNILWHNERAHHQLPRHIGETLRQMR
jgi:hypothetical protein